MYVLVRENMKLLGVRQDDAEESGRWRQLINCRDSREEQFKVKVPSLEKEIAV